MVATTPTPAAPAESRTRWVHGPVLDVAMALCWVPFAIAGLVLQDDRDHLTWFVGATLLLSFSHQPLTLALVYGDRTNFRLRRRIFTWSPLVFAVAVFVTRNGTNKAVDDISFTVELGKITAIIGESGSGKSVACYSIE